MMAKRRQRRRQYTSAEAGITVQTEQEFRHSGNIRLSTERAGVVEFIKLPGDPVPTRTTVARNSIPGIARRPVERFVADADGNLVLDEHGQPETYVVHVPVGRRNLVAEPYREDVTVQQQHSVSRVIFTPPNPWTADDVLVWLKFAHIAIKSAVTDPGRALGYSLAPIDWLMASAEADTLVNAPYIPSASEITLAEWVLETWPTAIDRVVERVALMGAIQGRSWRKIGPTIGRAAGDTNATKSITYTGLERIVVLLERMPMGHWPDLAGIEFVEAARAENDGGK